MFNYRKYKADFQTFFIFDENYFVQIFFLKKIATQQMQGGYRSSL